MPNLNLNKSDIKLHSSLFLRCETNLLFKILHSMKITLMTKKKNKLFFFQLRDQ